MTKKGVMDLQGFHLNKSYPQSIKDAFCLLLGRCWLLTPGKLKVMDNLLPQLRYVTQSKKWACRMLVVSCSHWLYLQYRKPVCFGNSLPRASSSAVFFKAFAVSCFSQQLQSFPPTNGAGKGPATSQHDRGFLALIHPLSHTYVHSLLFPWGKHKLDIAACKKVIFILWQTLSVQSYFKWMLSSVVIRNISSFIQE